MDSIINLTLIFQFWIIFGIIFLGLELFDGSTIFFFPLSLSSFLVSGYVFISEKASISSISILDTWYELVFLWAFLGLLISLILVKFWKKPSDDDDINKY